jgi:hypothetical protein
MAVLTDMIRIRVSWWAICRGAFQFGVYLVSGKHIFNRAPTERMDAYGAHRLLLPMRWDRIQFSGAVSDRRPLQAE